MKKPKERNLVTISIRLPKSLHSAMEKRAENQTVSIAAIVRQALKKFCS